MRVVLVKTIIVALAIILWLSGCQKEIYYPMDNHPVLNNSANSSVNNEKQDRKILFVSNRDGNDEIYAMNEDGTNTVRLTYNNVPDGRASWSPNGQMIAFASGQPGL